MIWTMTTAPTSRPGEYRFQHYHLPSPVTDRTGEGERF